jgi:hypothetical protein
VGISILQGVRTLPRSGALALPAIDPFSRVTTISQKMQPKMHPVTLGERYTSLSTSRQFLLPVLPLAYRIVVRLMPTGSTVERIVRKAAWMEKQLLKPPADIWLLTAT